MVGWNLKETFPAKFRRYNMRRQFAKACFVSAFTFLGASPFVLSAQLPPEAPRTTVGEASESVSDTVDSPRNAVGDQTNVQQATPSNANGQSALNEGLQQTTPYQGSGPVEPRTQGTNSNRQQNQIRSGSQSQLNSSMPAQNQSIMQPHHGNPQYLQGNDQRLNSQNGVRNQWQAQPHSGRVYVMRYDASGREYICVNGRPVYFDNQGMNSSQSQSNAMRVNERYSSGYGSYEAQNGQSFQLQNSNEALNTNRGSAGQTVNQDRN
jgi:hypothetical protein